MRVTFVPPCTYVSSSAVFSMPVCRYPITGLTRSTSSEIELHHQPQHAVRRRVLRTHVDDHRVVERVFRPHAAAREHDLLCAGLRAGCNSCAPSDVCRSRRSSSSSTSLRVSVIGVSVIADAGHL